MSSSTDRAQRSRAEAPRGRRGFVRRLLADTRGTATTETVIMIPMFAIVWGCIFFVFSFFQHTIAMRSMTRGHVWAFAYVGCPDGSSAPGTNLGTASATQLSHPGVASIIDSVIATILEIKWGHGDRHTRTTRPRILGAGTIDQTDELYVMCNRIPRSNGSFFGDFVSQLFAH